MSEKYNKSKRTFTSLVRRPYQDAIAVLLKTYDYHREMSMKGYDSNWHNKQAEVLRTYLIDLKDYIVKLENERRLERKDTET
tara:strand:+ start:387 stop:632 length:246 start_codon:yes stop_codon:yes gene_type:complete